MSFPIGAAWMVSAICGKIEVWIAGQLASVALIATFPGTAITGTAAGEQGMSKSSGRTNSGEADARRRRGEGVGGESESEISSIRVHSSPVTGWEAAGCSDVFAPQKARGDKATVVVLWRGLPTGRFGDVDDARSATLTSPSPLVDRVGETELDRTMVLSLRGCCGRFGGTVTGPLLAASSFRGRPTGRFGDCEVRRASVISLRGRPTGRFGDNERRCVVMLS
jgi:hypothetical protein